jgi:hypothetical protein
VTVRAFLAEVESELENVRALAGAAAA